MSQSRAHSALEAIANTAIGYVISLITWAVVAWAMHIPVTWDQSLIITAVFTVVSLVRSYVLRRLFNWWHVRVVNG